MKGEKITIDGNNLEVALMQHEHTMSAIRTRHSVSHHC